MIEVYETTVGAIDALMVKLCDGPMGQYAQRHPEETVPHYWQTPSNVAWVSGWGRWAEDVGGPESGPKLHGGWRLQLVGAAGSSLYADLKAQGWDEGSRAEAETVDLPEPTAVTRSRGAVLLSFVSEEGRCCQLRLKLVERWPEALATALAQREEQHGADPSGGQVSSADMAESLRSLGRVRP